SSPVLRVLSSAQCGSLPQGPFRSAAARFSASVVVQDDAVAPLQRAALIKHCCSTGRTASAQLSVGPPSPLPSSPATWLSTGISATVRPAVARSSSSRVESSSQVVHLDARIGQGECGGCERCSQSRAAILEQQRGHLELRAWVAAQTHGRLECLLQGQRQLALLTASGRRSAPAAREGRAAEVAEQAAAQRSRGLATPTHGAAAAVAALDLTRARHGAQHLGASRFQLKAAHPRELSG
ncbi:hypothetical protein MC885_002152, partial [Smutsia gigantea]